MENQELYDKYVGDKHWKDHKIDSAKSFSELLKNKGFSGKLVDLGCGTGRDVKYFFNQGFDVLGVDYDLDEILDCRERFPECNFEIENVEKMNFEDESVDAFHMVNVIHYVNKKKAFSEIYRCLKRGGLFLIQINLKITDDMGGVDYTEDKEKMLSLVSDFKILDRRIFNRIDPKPFRHVHEILELVLLKE